MSDPFVFTDFPPDIPPADIALAAAIYHKLEAEYPGHRWLVNADHDQGVASVKLMYLDKLGKNGLYGYRLMINDLKSDPGLKSVVTAGGEMLERYGIPRTLTRVDAEVEERALEHGLDLTR